MPGCKILAYPLVTQGIRSMLAAPSDADVNCKRRIIPLVLANTTHIWVNEDATKSVYQIYEPTEFYCCYRNFSAQGTFENIGYGPCDEFTTNIRGRHEFVRVDCFYYSEKIYEDVFKFNVYEKVPQKVDKKAFSVLMFGIDNISRKNFLRTMPKTAQFLKSRGSVQFLGFNKLGDNSLPNIMPMLAAQSFKESENICFRNNIYDAEACPFIWDQFKKANYQTALGSDSAIGVLDLNEALLPYKPTDFYMQAFNFETRHTFKDRTYDYHLCLRNRYIRAYKNLQMNSLRLTTPYDVHETLMDIINITSLEDRSLKERARNISGNERAFSLFLPVPASRTCKSSQIPEHWCSCLSGEITTVSEKGRLATAKYVMRHINQILSEYPRCRQLSIEKILEVTVMKNEDSNRRTYRVLVQAKPGGGVFEATLLQEHPHKQCSTKSASTDSPEKEPPKPGLMTRLKIMYRDYWYVTVPVHMVTSAIWFGSFYYVVSSGVDVLALVESIGISEKLTAPLKESGAGYFAVSLALYKLVSPLRYAVTIGGTTFAIKRLEALGWIKPVPSKERLKEMYQEKKDNFQDRKAQYQVQMKEKRSHLMDEMRRYKQDMKNRVKKMTTEQPKQPCDSDLNRQKKSPGDDKKI
ncbi:hypothetical protein NE865_14707 [Phthorimaea operculella]|nr:hypothetical protein NE865_14707 [Phthorimaea operculella]